MQKQSKIRGIVIFTLAVIFLFTMFYLYNQGDQGEVIEYDALVVKIQAGEVSKIQATGGYIRVLLKTTTITAKEFDDGKEADYNATFQAGAITDLRAEVKAYNDADGRLEADKIGGNWLPAESSLLDTIMPYLTLIIVGVLAFLVIKSISNANNKSMSFGKTNARTGTMSKIRFADIAGSEEEKQELQEIVDFLKHPKKYIDAGAKIPKGVLLVGPPGTGKTLLAKAIAGESNVPFFSISGSDFVEMFVGVGASRVRDLFDQAKRNLPCIVFIDEIDAVGRQRGAGLGGGNDEREQTLNQLLVQMDGFETNEGIIVIAATNRPDVLDPALLRPGRFDRQIYVSMPDARGREAILKVHSKNKKFASDVNLTDIARLTAGFSGADLANLLNEAAILAARDNRTTISRVDVNEGVNKVVMGPQKKSRKVTERDRKITAYHEAGHAVLEKMLPNCDEVHEVSIIPRGMAGGYTMSRPENDDNYATINKLNDMIASMMGGRIAEEIIFKDISTGASNDIQQATKLARKMVTEFGMSKKLGFINLGSSSEVFLGRDYQTQVKYSDKTASEIDEEIIDILKFNYERAKKIVLENQEKLENLTQLLLEKETIYQEEVEQIMKGKTVKNVIRSMNRRQELRNKVVEEERRKFKESEEKRLALLRQQTIEALKREGIIVKAPVQPAQKEETKKDDEGNK